MEDTLCPLFINDHKIKGYFGRFFLEFNKSIPEVISLGTGIEIDPTDELPMSICSDCERQLIALNEFRQRCLLSNNYLLELKREPENVDDPLNSLKPPELVLVDDMKDEEKDVDSVDSEEFRHNWSC